MNTRWTALHAQVRSRLLRLVSGELREQGELICTLALTNERLSTQLAAAREKCEGLDRERRELAFTVQAIEDLIPMDEVRRAAAAYQQVSEALEELRQERRDAA